nr:hypothetical protein [Tanacetum cinerariifolium]
FFDEQVFVIIGNLEGAYTGVGTGDGIATDGIVTDDVTVGAMVTDVVENEGISNEGMVIDSGADVGVQIRVFLLLMYPTFQLL